MCVWVYVLYTHKYAHRPQFVALYFLWWSSFYPIDTITTHTKNFVKKTKTERRQSTTLFPSRTHKHTEPHTDTQTYITTNMGNKTSCAIQPARQQRQDTTNTSSINTERGNNEFRTGSFVLLSGEALADAVSHGEQPIAQLLEQIDTSISTSTSTDNSYTNSDSDLVVVQFFRRLSGRNRTASLMAAERDEDERDIMTRTSNRKSLLLSIPGRVKTIPATGNISPLPLDPDTELDEGRIREALQMVLAKNKHVLREPRCSSGSYRSAQLYGRKLASATDPVVVDLTKKVLDDMTRVRGRPGFVRYTVFSCYGGRTIEASPSLFNVRQASNAADEEASMKHDMQHETNCQHKPVVIATIHTDSGTNRYALVVTPTEDELKEAFLVAYGVEPLNLYKESIDWEHIPLFCALRYNTTCRDTPCMSVNAIWVMSKVGVLIRSGCVVSRIENGVHYE